MKKSNNIELKTFSHIDIIPESNKESFYNKFKKTINKKNNYGILVERRNHKVITDENKLYGTKESHKYY